MEEETTSNGGEREREKKTLKRHPPFLLPSPQFSQKRRCAAHEAGMEINSFGGLCSPSVLLTHSSLVSFTAPSLKLTKNGVGGGGCWFVGVVGGGGLAYFPVRAPFLTVCEAKSFGSPLF